MKSKFEKSSIISSIHFVKNNECQKYFNIFKKIFIPNVVGGWVELGALGDFAPIGWPTIHISIILLGHHNQTQMYKNCRFWIKFCSLCTKGLSCTEGSGILDKIVVYGCRFKPDNITITGEFIDQTTEDFEFDEDTLRLDVNQLFGVDFCSGAFSITWSKNIFLT